MLRHEGNHLGDTWYYVEGDICHCYYLTCPESVPRHTDWEIAHATSRDMVHWELQGTVLRKGDAGEWDANGISTGSVIRYKGTYWMAYTGQWNGPVGMVGLASSKDLYHWEKCSYNPVTCPDDHYYAMNGAGVRTFSHWRDPYLFTDGDYAYHLTCATRKGGRPDACGTAGLARSRDMEHWELLRPMEIEAVCQEMECPQIHLIDGHYVLLFSCYGLLFSDEYVRKYGRRLRQTSYYMISDSMFGPYRFCREWKLLPDDFEDPDRNVQYANQLVEKDGRWYLLGTVWSEQGDYIPDPLVYEMKNGALRLIDERENASGRNYLEKLEDVGIITV